MSAEESKAVMLRIWKEILNDDRIEKAGEFVADGHVYHGPGGHDLRGDRESHEANGLDSG